MSEVTIQTLLRGRARPFAEHKLSAIAKATIDGPVEVCKNGLEGDEQADRRHHGGEEKAIHHYPREHYADWSTELDQDAAASTDRDALLKKPGAFGENVSTEGLTESTICVGDLWQMGTALVEVSQARQPCWKLNHRFEFAEMARRVQTSGRTGWYYRVREEGIVEAGAKLELVQRPHPDWPLSRILHTFYVDRKNWSALRELTSLDALSPSWRTLAEKRLINKRVESWNRRLTGK